MAQSSSTHSQQGQAQQLLAPGAKGRERREVPMADSRLQQPWGLGWDLTQTSGPQHPSSPCGSPSKGGWLMFQCMFSAPGCEICSSPHLPVHRGSDLLVCCQLQGVHHSQDLIKVSPSGGWVQDGEFQLLIWAKNEHLSTGRQGQGWAEDICLPAQPCCSSLSWEVASLAAGVGTQEMPWWESLRETRRHR